MRLIIGTLILAIYCAAPGFGATIIFEDDFTDAGAFDASNWTHHVTSMHAHQGLTSTGLDVIGEYATSIYDAPGYNVDPILTGMVGQDWSVSFLLAFSSDGSNSSFGFDTVESGSSGSLERTTLLRIKGNTVYTYGNGYEASTVLTNLTPSVDANGDHDFLDEGDSLSVYSVTIAGDYTGDTLTQTISFTDANGTTLTDTSNVYTTPTYLGSGLGYTAPTSFMFWNIKESTNSTPTNTVVIDDVVITAGVAVPEPSTIMLLLSGVVALFWRRRQA